MGYFVNDNIKSSIVEYDSNFQNDIALIFKNDFKEIVLCIGQVQSGKTNKIFKCIEESLFNLEYNIVILFGGTNNYLFEQTKKRLNKNFKQYKNEIIFLDKSNYSYYKYDENKKYIINIIKNINNLKKAFNFIDNIDLNNKKILIIDDESDYASINTNGEKPTSTYSKINEIYSRIYNGKLLQITATPFANIISNNSKQLSPNRVVCWSTNTDYKGLYEFFEVNKNEIIYEIIVANKKDALQNKEAIIKTLKYFLSILIINFEKYKNIENGVSCLFNIDSSNDTHDSIAKIIKRTIENIDSARKKFYSEYISYHMEEKEFNNKWDYILNNLNYQILNLRNKKIGKKYQYNIYIGGIFLSRGNTFENLITELIINVPNEEILLDTLLQRCRWFGYRKNTIEDMKIFLNQKTYDALKEAINYLKLLEPGEHDVNELNRKIKSLDINKNFVISTSKQKRK